MKTLAVLVWLVWAGCLAALLAGNQTAINGVVGCGVGAVVITACAWLARD